MAQAARQRYSYFDGTAARAYDYSSRTQRRTQQKTRPDMTVIPGRRSENPAYATISETFARAFKYTLVILAVLGVICGLRIWLWTSTVSALGSVNELESSLTSAQAQTNELEIQHSILSSSTRIEQEAANLGMVAPENVTYLKVVIPSKIMTNADGSISLADTIKNVQDYAAIVAN